MKQIWHKKYFAPDTGDGKSGADTTDYKTLYEQSQADYAKLKTSFDRTSSEVATLKKTLGEKQTDEEKRSQAEAEREQHYKAIERENAVYKYKASLSGQIADSKVLQQVAELYADGDIAKALEVQNGYYATARTELEKQIKSELLKTNPQATPQSVSTQKSYSEMTLDERTALKQKDPQLYEQLKHTK